MTHIDGSDVPRRKIQEQKITGGIGNSESMPKSGLSEKVTFILRLNPEKESTVRESARAFKAEGTANTMN